MSEFRPSRAALLRLLRERAGGALAARIETLRAAAAMEAARDDAPAPQAAIAPDGLSGTVTRFGANDERRSR